MARGKGTANLSASLEVLAGAPLDSRAIVPTVADLTVSSNFPYKYVGMLVAVQATGELYMLTAADTTVADNWKLVGSDNEGINNVVEGYFNETDDLFYEEDTFTTPIEGASKVIYIDLINNWTYRFEDPIFVRLDEEVSNDVVDGYYYNGEFYGNDAHTAQIPHRYNRLYVDVPTNKIYRYTGITDGYVCVNEGQIVQVASLPTADADTLGKIYQYVGETDTDYTNGYFYKCVEGETAGTYEWEAVSVQAGGSSSGTFGKDITASVDIGGIKIGDAYHIGDNYDDFIQDLIDPIKYPSLSNPSATISASGTLLETGASVSKTLTVNFSRGTISPAYGTSGYRSGAATGYSLNNGTSQSGNTFTQTVSESNKTFKAKVTYAAGEQPLDSKGNNYSTPLASGSVETTTLTFDFVDAIWANTSAINTVAKLALVSKSTKVKEFNFPAQTVANPEEFHIPASWTVTAVEVLNTLSNQWESCASEFTTGTTTHNNAGGTAVNYVTYKDNRGYAAAARKVRVKWS